MLRDSDRGARNDAIATSVLGFKHALVGSGKKFGSVFAIFRKAREPSANRHPHRVLTIRQCDWCCGDALPQSFDFALGCLEVGLRQDQHEFFSAVPPSGVTLANRTA